MNKPTKIIVSIVIAVGLFYGGFVYGQSRSTSGATSTTTYAGTRAGRTGSTTGAFGGAGGLGGGSATIGTVVSSDATSITVALKSGSVIVFYSTSTPIIKTTAGTSDDISAGSNITVIGSTNSDGSVTANSIQLRETSSQ